MENLFSLEGRKAVVIGGGGGIGQSIAKGLAFYGAEVAIASRSIETLRKAAGEIKKESGKAVHLITVDCSSEESVAELTEKCIGLMGAVHILVNSQGLNMKKSALDFDMDVWDQMFDVNVKGMMITCKHFGRGMKEQRYGRIVNVSSIRGVRAINGDLGNTCYSTTKGAVDMLTKSLAGEWAQYNITVNAIGPILTMTDMMKPMFENNKPLYEKVCSSIPMGRIGFPDDCIGASVFLASDAAAFITGQVIYPDGGSCCVG